MQCISSFYIQIIKTPYQTYIVPPHKLDLGLINGWGHYNGMTGCFYEYLPVK